MNRKSALVLLALFFLLPLRLRAADPKLYTLGMIAKSHGNPFVEAAHAGANDAARDLSAKHGVTIKIDWRTPNEEDAQKQAEMLEQLVLRGADGVIISCSDALKLTDAINKAVRQ